MSTKMSKEHIVEQATIKAAEKTVEKRAAFVKLANQRVSKAVKATGLISNLGNTYRYGYSQVDIDQIKAALLTVTSEVISKLENGLKSTPESAPESAFTLAEDSK